MVEDLDILIWLLPPLASGGLSTIAYGTSVSQGGAYVLFIQKLQVLDIHQGTENAHLDIEVALWHWAGCLPCLSGSWTAL